ncbi:MAG: DNA-3-methyladenine glycosylase [Fibrobacteria bacterium]
MKAPSSRLKAPVKTGKAFPISFYARPTIEVARDLLGAVLVHQAPEGRTAGRIVETEAYLRDDPACHAFRGPTPRTQIMFGPPGRAYIYLIYGMYDCFNVVTAPAGTGEAVLIRALEPLEGLPLMARRRGTERPKDWCSGPGKLVIAMGIGRQQNGADLRGRAGSALSILSLGDAPGNVKVTTRIGINKAAHLPLRFYLEGNAFISKA